MDRTEENRQEYKELQCRVKREVSKAKPKAYDELYTRLDTREGEKDLYRLGENRVPREELWYCMRKSGVVEKYVRVVQDMYERSRTVVRCAVGQTEEFNVEVGLHQGSALSPFLFAIVMDQLSEEVRQESPWTMMFADDIVICSESREQVEENLERWRFALERRGMKVSHSKTEYMCVNEREGSGTVRLQGEEVKKVQEFKYLGSTVQSNGECGKEAAPLSIVEVKIDKLPPEVGKNMLLTLRGAYNEDQIVSTSQKSNLMQTLRYFVSKDVEPMIELQADGKEARTASSPPSPLSSASTSEFTFSFPAVKDTVNLQVNTVESSEEDMKVRLDFDIPAEEKAFLLKRREVVSRALQKILKLKSPLEPSKVPTVAMVCTGGGARAMTGMYGSLKGLQSLGLLDVISYITSLSGSTWTNAYLYNDPHWSEKDLDEAINLVKKELSKGTKTLFGPSRLRYYYSELRQKQKDGHSISPIDMWGLIIENAIYGKKHEATLSDQQEAVSEGQNPLPIYTAVNMKRDAGGSMMAEFCQRRYLWKYAWEIFSCAFLQVKL
ncbi:hypothetical protein QTP70_009975 [Hemibagrus guttatus]|uniref:ribonuclease H n=1 Tax=Hemibagrus guttatus TaxID=175788 RepID=A0AAE0QZI6_9TELE|nr:hypothetical protein QTP70_009975 [Hemibagrus guttatus]